MSEAEIPSSPGFNAYHSSFSGDSNPEVDPEYEYDAPKYTPFKHATSDGADQWFENQDDTPYTDRAYEVEPLYDPNADVMTPDGSYRTPTDSELFDGEASTPRPSRKQLEFESSDSANAQDDEEDDDEVQQVTSKFAGLRARPFTPVRPSNLQTSTTWADMDDEPAAAKGKAVSFVPTRSTKPLTVPVEFKFSSRPKSAVSNVEAPAIPKSTAVKPAEKARPTVVKPFKLSENVQSQVKKDAIERSPYVSLAARMKQFDKTPDRFKSAPKSLPAPVPVVTRPAVPKVTKPMPPKFATDTRVKKETKVLSSEERVLEEMKSRAPFKANPVNVKILTSHGDLGVPRIKKVAPTVPISPNILKPRAKPTKNAEESTVPRVRAHPYIPVKKVFQPKIEHREIRPADFKLPGDKISEMKRQKFLEEVKKEEEELMKTHFKANPVNIDDVPLAVPKHVAKPDPTIPFSPALITKVRGKHHEAEMKKKIEEEEKKMKEMAEFKAHPVPDLDVPFIPKLGDQPITQPEPLVLNTEVRAEERKHFDMQLKEREEELEMMRAMQEKENEEREMEEAMRIRKNAEFKAQPILKAFPFEPKKSDKPLTEPISPYIGEKRRLLEKQ